MGLREQAALDAQTILNNTDGFGVPITVTDPGGTSAALTGFSTDIPFTIDPETGMAVSGRTASVALHMRDLVAAGLGNPKNIPDEDSRPWVVSFVDVVGITHTFKVKESNPDRASGVITCTLEVYNENLVVFRGVTSGGIQVTSGGVPVTGGP